jgi:hypothetical protein
MRRKYVAIFVICLICVVVALAWYLSLPRQQNGRTTYSVEYDLTKNGNHTQIQASYNNGAVTTEQLNWLNFDNKTAVYDYFVCTPSMTGCTPMAALSPFSTIVSRNIESRWNASPVLYRIRP